ncbi:MAG TPA: NAD-dependent epimerase/dehydratase family protein, partial [Actinomycetota bacterium]|nr:NAD-dependent epimerase/dehydratase family protein [Actinomycetota bacterium]
PVKETAIRGAQPVSPYGISKAVALDYLRFYRQNRGVDFTALALANIYGPRQDPFGEAGVVGIFGSKMLAGETPTIFGDGNQTRDYLFVDDTVHAFSLASDRGSGGLYNIGTGLETSVNRVFQLLAQVIGFRRKPSFGPPRKGDLLRSALDCSLAEKELGWKPWTALEDGFRETIEALRSS